MDKNKIIQNICAFLFMFLYFETNSQILNKVIRLGDHPFRYIQFSFNSEGNMFIYTGPNPINSQRNFFGIKKDGKGYFINEYNMEDYHSHIEIPNSDGRIGGESCFIKAKNNSDWEEYLIGISKLDTDKYETEFYNLNNRKAKYEYNYKTKYIFGFLHTISFSFLPDPLNGSNNFNYYTSYLANYTQTNYKLYSKIINFEINNLSNLTYKIETIEELEANKQSIISCFFTKNNKYICFYINNESNLTIWAFDILRIKNGNKTFIHNYTTYISRRFFKGIHYKNEIGFFAYFKDKEDMPSFSLYEIYDNNTALIYKNYGEIKATNGTYINNYEMLNDIIKLNNNTICFMGSSSKRNKLNILIFNFYDNDNYMNIKFYKINIWEENEIKLYYEFKLCLYNNFLVMAFSHCFKEDCTDEMKDYKSHFSSLIFFNYPNSTDIYFDIINYIYKDNKNIENDIIINFGNITIIDNNIFNYILNELKLLIILMNLI